MPFSYAGPAPKAGPGGSDVCMYVWMDGWMDVIM